MRYWSIQIYEIIKKSKVIYCAYSDLSTIINAIYTKSGEKSFYYNIWNVLSEKTWEIQQKNFREIFINNNFDINNLKIEFGNIEKAIILGGNLRCFAKLSGIS